MTWWCLCDFSNTPCSIRHFYCVLEHAGNRHFEKPTCNPNLTVTCDHLSGAIIFTCWVVAIDTSYWNVCSKRWFDLFRLTSTKTKEWSGWCQYHHSMSSLSRHDMETLFLITGDRWIPHTKGELYPSLVVSFRRTQQDIQRMMLIHNLAYLFYAWMSLWKNDSVIVEMRLMWRHPMGILPDT